MPLPTIADTIRTSVEGHCSNGHKFAYVWHFRKSGALTYPAAIALLDPLILAHLNTNLGTGVALKAFMCTTSGFEQVRYTPLDGSTATTVTPHVIAGTAAGDALPSNVALVVTFRTGNRGRSYRGRSYMTGWIESANDPTGVPSATNVTNMANQWAGFRASLVASGLTQVVASYRLALATDVASITVDSRWDTQRRRLNT